ncbi:MAG: amidase [Acidimicrobiales bacterium]
MSDKPWGGDVVSLVDAFRAGERHPREEVAATLAAVESDPLNTVCHVDAEAALAAAEHADVALPFGGVPLAVKELLTVAGWPDTEASVALADRVATADSIPVERLRAGGAIPTVQTTSSEFGGVNQTTTKLHGVTRNPWGPDRTPGGSSGGSAAGVAAGLFALASASDGGGSIRIPAGFCGLVGLKPTYGRVPKGPQIGNLTAVEGCVSRSVRDTARWLDVTNGFDRRDPFSLPRVDDYEARLGEGIAGLASLRVAIVPDLGCAVVAPETEEIVVAAAEALIAAMGATRVDIELRLPNIMGAWGLTGGIGIRKELGDRWPDCAGDLTSMMREGVVRAEKRIDLSSMVKAETRRQELNVAMAEMFDRVDLVLAATNPSTAFDAEGHLPSLFGGRESNPGNNGALTAPSNIYGNAAISLPAGLASDGLPVGLQVVAPHHAERVLLDTGLVWERTQPWPLTA